MSAHDYNPMCGCASCDRIERADELRDEHIQATSKITGGAE